LELLPEIVDPVLIPLPILGALLILLLGFFGVLNGNGELIYIAEVISQSLVFWDFLVFWSYSSARSMTP